MTANRKKTALGLLFFLGALFSFWGISRNFASDEPQKSTLSNIGEIIETTSDWSDREWSKSNYCIHITDRTGTPMYVTKTTDSSLPIYSFYTQGRNPEISLSNENGSLSDTPLSQYRFNNQQYHQISELNTFLRHFLDNGGNVLTIRDDTGELVRFVFEDWGEPAAFTLSEHTETAAPTVSGDGITATDIAKRYVIFRQTSGRNECSQDGIYYTAQHGPDVQSWTAQQVRSSCTLIGNATGENGRWKIAMPEAPASLYTFFYVDNRDRVSYAAVSVGAADYQNPSAHFECSEGLIMEKNQIYLDNGHLQSLSGDDKILGTITLADDIGIKAATATVYAGGNEAEGFQLTETAEGSHVYHLTAAQSDDSEEGEAEVSIEDGVYQVHIDITDTGGNTTSYDWMLYYDNTAPAIHSLTINGTVYNEHCPKLYNEDLSVIFTVDDMTPVTGSITAGGVPLPDDAILPYGEESHQFQFQLTDEFTGPVVITFTDKLGHKGSFSTDTLQIDKTPLEVTAVSLEDSLDILHSENLATGSSRCRFLVATDASDVGKISVTAGGQSAALQKSGSGYAGVLELPDGIYTAEVTLEDLAGNPSKATTKAFIVDTMPPVLNYARTENRLSFTLTDKNLTSMVNADIQCADANGSITDLDIELNGQKYNGSPDFIQSLFADKSKWQAGEDDTYTLEVLLLTEGNYTLHFTAKDDGKNESQAYSDTVTRDITEPDFTMASFSVPKREFSDYGYISSNTIGLTITGSDLVSGIQSVSVHYTDNQGKKIDGKCKTQSAAEGTYLYFFGKTSCEKGLIDSITLTDNCGNTRTVEFKNGIIIDRETEDIELLNLQIADDANGIKVLNRDLNLTFTLRDTYSGIASYEYTINGVKQQGSGDVKTITYEKILSDQIIASRNEGDDIRVEITATDNAGNSKTVAKTYSFDTTKPEIHVEYDTTTDNHYYKATRTATVTIRDNHFTETGVSFAITNSGTNTNTRAKFTSSDGKTYTASIPLADEGIYSFGLSATDMAGNTAVFKDSTLFTVDKTAPKLSISYDNQKASNGKYFNQARVANILVDELNFDESLVDISVQTKSGTVPNISSFSNRNTNHIAVMSFAVDGDYTISGTVTDMAGNISETVIEPAFIIDTKAPEIQFSHVKADVSYNGDIAPLCTVKDTNYDSAAVTLSGAKYGHHGEHYISSDKTETGETLQYASFAKVLTSDDAYVLTATAKDLAGNIREESISFKVNRFGSRYSLDKDTAEAVDKYYVSSQQEFVIIEDNLDRINNYKLCYVSNGATKVLDYNKDYSMDSSAGSAGWNIYTYHIKTDMLDSDGVYSFVVYSTDEAGNTSDNITKGVPLKVCLDKTAPIITISGVEDTVVYRKSSLKASIAITDNIAYDKATVILNGDQKEVTEPAFDIDIEESEKEQTLEVIAVDKAGNSISSDLYTFMVNRDADENTKVVSRRNHKTASSLPYIICMFLVLGVAIVLIVIWKKRSSGQDSSGGV